MIMIRAAEPAEWNAALELLHGDIDRRRRPAAVVNSLSLLASGELQPEGLLVCAPAGRVLASAVMIIGYGIIAVPTGIVTAELISVRSEYEKKRVCHACGVIGHESDARFCRVCGEPME